MRRRLDSKIGAGLKLDRSLVPPELQDMVLIVEKWAFNRLRDQDAFIKLMSKKHPDELDAFNQQFDKRRAAIVEWLRALPVMRPADAPDHPIWAFISVLKLREASGPATDPDEIRAIEAIKERMAKEFRIEQFKAATQAADNAFREGSFSGYLDILSPFEDLLSATQQQKLRIAKNRASQ